MTLRDTGVLDEDEEDMLENINMADYDRDEERVREERRLQGRYVSYSYISQNDSYHTH